MSNVTVGIFQARIGPEHPDQMASLGLRTRRSFRLEYIYEKGTAHANINKVLDRCQTRYCVICDDDVIFLDDNWLSTLLKTIEANEQIGMLVPVEIKTPELRDDYLKNGWGGQVVKPDFDMYQMSWLPGYVMVFDLERVPELRADENIPGPSGMSDLDLSLQVRSAGYKCIWTTRTVVYHPIKPLDVDWRQKWDIVQEHELPALHQQQVAYMRTKWGPFYEDAVRGHMRGSF